MVIIQMSDQRILTTNTPTGDRVIYDPITHKEPLVIGSYMTRLPVKSYWVARDKAFYSFKDCSTQTGLCVGLFIVSTQLGQIVTRSSGHCPASHRKVSPVCDYQLFSMQCSFFL